MYLCVWSRRGTLRRPDRLVLCQQMEACIIHSGGSFMLFLFLSHHCSQRQTKQDLATERKQGLQAVFLHWPSCPPILIVKQYLHGLAQGSILSPMLFSIYMLPLSHTNHQDTISYHFYADNTHFPLGTLCNVSLQEFRILF